MAYTTLFLHLEANLIQNVEQAGGTEGPKIKKIFNIFRKKKTSSMTQTNTNPDFTASSFHMYDQMVPKPSL